MNFLPFGSTHKIIELHLFADETVAHLFVTIFIVYDGHSHGVSAVKGGSSNDTIESFFVPKNLLYV